MDKWPPPHFNSHSQSLHDCRVIPFNPFNPPTTPMMVLHYHLVLHCHLIHTLLMHDAFTQESQILQGNGLIWISSQDSLSITCSMFYAHPHFCAPSCHALTLTT